MLQSYQESRAGVDGLRNFVIKYGFIKGIGENTLENGREDYEEHRVDRDAGSRESTVGVVVAKRLGYDLLIRIF